MDLKDYFKAYLKGVIIALSFIPIFCLIGILGAMWGLGSAGTAVLSFIVGCIIAVIWNFVKGS